MQNIGLMLLEDNRILREGLTATISKRPGLEVLASLGNAADALLKAKELKPQVMLMDLSLGEQNSLDLVRAFKKEIPQAAVVMMDLIPTEKDVLAFMKAGASGFILKDATVDDFLKTIRLVAEGEKVLPPSLTGSLFSQIAGHVGTIDSGEVSESVRLTEAERNVIEMIADGLSNEEIAHRLGVAVYRVKTHINNVLEKLALRSGLDRLQTLSLILLSSCITRSLRVFVVIIWTTIPL